MKDQNDVVTLPLLGVSAPQPPAPQGRGAVGGAPKKPRFKLLPRTNINLPAVAKAANPDDPCWPVFGRSVVPVSFVARDWCISSRRVRVMLAEGRLEGRRLENGYWEVLYPYRYVIGTRGPATTRQKNYPPRPKKAERNAEW